MNDTKPRNALHLFVFGKFETLFQSELQILFWRCLSYKQICAMGFSNFDGDKRVLKSYTS